MNDDRTRGYRARLLAGLHCTAGRDAAVWVDWAMTRTSARTSSTVSVYHCDLCGEKAGGSKCSLCKRDICSACRVDDPDDWSDYPTKYCRECWALPEREAYYAYKRESETRLDALEAAWKAAGIR